MLEATHQLQTVDFQAMGETGQSSRHLVALDGDRLASGSFDNTIRVRPLLHSAAYKFAACGSAFEFEEAARLRITLETDLVRAAAARFTDDDKALAMAALENIGDAENVGDLMAAHDAFHDAIYVAAESPITHEIVRGLRARCSRYLGFMWKRLANAALSHDEHRQLLEFVSSGDGQAAADFMKPHIEGSTSAVLACLAAESGRQ